MLPHKRMLEAVLTARQTDLTVLCDVADDSQGDALQLLGPHGFTNFSQIHSSPYQLTRNYYKCAF
jgi:hypothetical protein